MPPDCPAELIELIGADIIARCVRRWSRKHHELGPCLVRTGDKGQRGRYGRVYDAAIGKTDYVHLVVWRRCYPERPIPKGWIVDHLCEVGLCARPDHLDERAVTKAENTRRRHQRSETVPTATITEQPRASTESCEIALFRGISNPRVQPRTVTLDELAPMLGRFEVLEDKRRGRCWSPTKYAVGATSRGNAGVESVSCLVFDLDRVPPDPKRLNGMFWIGHTTWSHRPGVPRWRVVIPLVRPVAAADWRDVWQRARAALCPEADPACKDPSRAYWLPSHAPDVKPETVHHAGPLLDPRTLPELPADPPLPSRRRVRIRDGDSRRVHAYMAKVIGNLEKVAPGSRNAALNHAAWTIGRWVAAGALEQAAVEDALYAAAERNGLVADDGQRQAWATIRSGLSKGARAAAPLDANVEFGL